MTSLLQAAWRSLVPATWRARLPDGLRDYLRRKLTPRRRLPTRLTFPRIDRAGGPPVRIVIFGEFADDWLSTFLDPKIWTGIEGVTEVVRVADRPGARLPPPAFADSRTVVIPLGLPNIRNCPTHLPALIPDGRALDALGNKKSFAAYMAAGGLADFCPKVFAADEEAGFPCVIKRADLGAGWGIAIARSPEDLARLRQATDWRGKDCVVQAFVPGAIEHVTHCVCRDGVILWHCSFACEMQHPEQIRSGMEDQTITPAVATPRVLDQIGRVLAPLGYSGPCCVDYKLSPAGDIVIFEINPRFGGTLMMPQHADRLREALACIIRHAR